MTREDAIELIRKSPLAEHAEALAELLQPSLRVDATRVEQADLAIGESRFGGEPDLPDEFEWPTFNEAPLAFIAQIDLAAIAGLESTLDLPAEGWLLFFYDETQESWGFDPDDREGSLVIHVPAGAALSRRALPPATGDGTFDAFPCRLGFEQRHDLVDVLHAEPSLPFDVRREETWEQYEELCLALTGDEPANHLFGCPQTVQGEMRLECQLVSNGIYCGGPSGYKDPRAKKLAAGADDWQLLLQVDSDEDGPGWMWGDCGRLYFWMRRQDAAERDFARAWTVLQCH